MLMGWMAVGFSVWREEKAGIRPSANEKREEIALAA